jgi:hypothetical protein
MLYDHSIKCTTLWHYKKITKQKKKNRKHKFSIYLVWKIQCQPSNLQDRVTDQRKLSFVED